MTVPASAETYTACRPNIGAAGRRRRRQLAVVTLIVALVLLAVLIVRGDSAPLRLLVAIPLASAAVTGLQSRRHTCVHMAMTGKLEHEDFTTEAVDAAHAEASRKMARTILRDGILLGLVGGVLAAATAFIH